MSAEGKDVAVVLGLIFGSLLLLAVVGRGCNQDSNQHELNMQRAKACESAK